MSVGVEAQNVMNRTYDLIIKEKDAEIERLKGIIEEAEHCQWCATNDDAPGDCDCFKAKVEAT